jgi:hypothetical protein
MQDTFYIVTTILFGLFVIFMGVVLWRALRCQKCVEPLVTEPDNEREIIYAFCNESKPNELAATKTR